MQNRRRSPIAVLLLLLLALDGAVIAALFLPASGQAWPWLPLSLGWSRESQSASPSLAGHDSQPETPHGLGRSPSSLPLSSGGTASETGLTAESGDPYWAYCQRRLLGQQVTPVTVAITYLEPIIDENVSVAEVNRWLGSIDPMSVDVYKLAHRDGRRRIAIEVSRAKWPGWAEAVGAAQGEALCSRLRAVLLAAGVGRPLPLPDTAEANDANAEAGARTPRDSNSSAPSDSSGSGQLAAVLDAMRSTDDDDPNARQTEQIGVAYEPSRHDFEFIYARRPHLYRRIEWVGTWAHVSADDGAEGGLQALKDWLGNNIAADNPEIAPPRPSARIF